MHTQFRLRLITPKDVKRLLALEVHGFTDAAGINIAKITKPIRERIIRDYFATDGIEYNLNRVPIGSADFSIRPYTYDDDAVDESLDKFALQFEDHLFKIPYMKLAQQVSPHKPKHFGSNWGSPAWMKTNNKINNGGHLRGEAGGKHYKLYAKYMIKFVQEYAKESVPIWGLTVENEPAQNSPTFPWGSIFFNSTMERDFVKLDLGPELNAAGLTEDKLKVIVYDDSLLKIKNFVSTILNDKDAAKYISASAFHWYENTKSNYSDLDYLYEHYPGKLLLSTESCLGFGRGDYGVEWQFFKYASDIIMAMNHHVSGYTDWNLVVDFNGGPNWANFTGNAPIVVNLMRHEYYKQPFFYAMGHFSKFVVPDSVCIGHTVPNLPKGIMMTAFERPDNGTVLTVMNENWGTPVEVQVHDPRRGYFNVKVKPESLEKFVWY